MAARQTNLSSGIDGPLLAPRAVEGPGTGPAPRSEQAREDQGSIDEMVSLGPIKELIRGMRTDHPLRIVLNGEPDEMPQWEYRLKVSGWVRLLYSVKE